MNINNLFPIVITKEIEACKEFYIKNFEFEVIFDSDWYIQLKNPSGIELAFMLPGLENQPELLQKRYCGDGVVLSFETDDAEKEYNRIKGLDANIVFDLRNEEWGQIHFMVKDPSGMIVDVVQHV